jgi:heptosyltransferase III
MKGDVLVIHQGALGDLMLTLCALNRFLSADQMDIFCRRPFVALMRHLHAVGQAFDGESRGLASVYAGDPEERLRSLLNSYRTIVVFSGSSDLTRNIASIVDCPVYGVLPRPRPDEKIHVVDYLTAQLQTVLSDRSKRCDPDILNPEKSSPSVVETVLLHPGSGSPRKNWPLDHYLRIYRNLVLAGIEAEWIIGPADRSLHAHLRSAGIPENEIQADLDLVNFCRRAATHAIGFVGNDSGLTHLAAYLEIPVIAVFGPSDPVRWRPVGRNVTVVGAASACPPCFETLPQNCAHDICLKEISPDEILSLLSEKFFACAPLCSKQLT